MVDDTRLELVTSRTSSGCATSCANRPCLISKGYFNRCTGACQVFFSFSRQKSRNSFLTLRGPCIIICKLTIEQPLFLEQNVEMSRSWSSAHDWKSCKGQKLFESSNLSISATSAAVLFGAAAVFFRMAKLALAKRAVWAYHSSGNRSRAPERGRIVVRYADRRVCRA